MKRFEKAVAIALSAHHGQKDHANEPYILHVFRVIEGVRQQGFMDDDYLTVAALHDVVEDTDWTLNKLLKVGMKNAVVVAVDCLTHRKKESYPDYIQRVKKNKIATVVKIADLTDHLKRPNADKFHKYETYRESLATLVESGIIVERILKQEEASA